MSFRPRVVLVHGDGPAAWAVAAGLARVGWAVTVRRRLAAGRNASRIELLAASAARFYPYIGLSGNDLKSVAKPCPGTWSCWGYGGPASVDAISSPYGASWSVDRASFDALLRTRALEMGVVEDSTETFFPKGDSDHWQILASGAVSNRTVAPTPTQYDDRLIAFVGCGRLVESCAGLDSRLLIEALPDGWAYGLLGPRGTVGVAYFTDALCLAGKDPKVYAADALYRTERISRLFGATRQPLQLAAVPVPCRWRALRAGPGVVRVGDAHASFDPVAGRGLWEALRLAAQLSEALSSGANVLEALEQASRASYQAYLEQRRKFYADALERFETPFWVRRVPSITIGSARP